MSLGPPRRKASRRDVPVPGVLVEALAAHLSAFPPAPREIVCRDEAGRTHGESVKVVQRRLGHASATETLDTYSHLWPDSEDRTRDAVDSVLGRSCGPSVSQAAPQIAFPQVRRCWGGEPAGKPDSVPARSAGGDHLSRVGVAAGLVRPTWRSAGHLRTRLLGLAPDGVYLAAGVAAGAVRSYRTLSPLPRAPRCHPEG